MRKFADPAPLGLSAFALTTFVLSLINTQQRDVTIPNVVVGLALFYGGLGQLLAGMWEFASGNTFGATAFTSYGGFWMSYATVLLPNSGVLAAYQGTTQLHDALGYYLLGWAVFTFILFLATFRSTAALTTLFFLLTVTFVLLSAGEFTQHVTWTKAGGWLGIVVACVAWYAAGAVLITRESSYFELPVGPLPKSFETRFGGVGIEGGVKPGEEIAHDS
ncbi:GPR1/FUN34/yaaH family-domain-containing protein [Zopfochytrium polystomum]|nr:GPR1/FUN34/yaaH family-domain-containing protein [Zopfochytrium polystomum]